jgi:hypothetical protein
MQEKDRGEEINKCRHADICKILIINNIRGDCGGVEDETRENKKERERNEKN